MTHNSVGCLGEEGIKTAEGTTPAEGLNAKKPRSSLCQLKPTGFFEAAAAWLDLASQVMSKVELVSFCLFFSLLLREKIGQRKGGRIDSFHWCSFMLFFYPAFLFQSYTSFSLSSSTYNVLDYFGGFCKLYSNIFFCKSVNSIKYPFDVYPLFFC